ncbi:MAG: SRPBCC domain-containing protein [Pseudomonadota bacterium]
MKNYDVSISINADPDTIWSVLIDAPNYPEWNESVDKVEGTIALGQQVKVFAKVSPGRAFPVKVAEFVPSEKMVWQGGMPLGLFKGVRTYTLTGNHPVEFRMQEVFSGLMAPLITRSMPDLTEAFNQFAEGLKRKSESL